MSSNTADTTTSGVAFVTTRWVNPERVADYRAWGAKVQAQLEHEPGFISAEQLPAVAGQQDFWTHIVRFANKEDSQRWAHSPELAALLEEIEGYTENSEISAVRTGKNDWLNFGLSTKPGPGAPQKWKQLIAGIMALYPTVIIAHELLERLITVPFALSTLLTNAIAMSLVMMIWLPQLSKLLRGWLLPAEPLPASKTIGVAIALLAVIGACLALFLALFPN